jgi:hypothetical protein
MMTIYEGILTLSGMYFLMTETTMFDINNTKVVANPIPNPLKEDVVTPRVGQSPRSNTNTAFSLKKPLLKLFHWLISSVLMFCYISVITALYSFCIVMFGTPADAVQVQLLRDH